MGERQVEVGDLVLAYLPDRADHVDDRAVVAMAEHAALWWSGGAGGVDERERILRTHGGATRFELLRGAPAPAFADLLERDRPQRTLAGQSRSRGAVPREVAGGGSITMTVRRVGTRSRMAAILASCSLVLAYDRAGTGVGDHPQALLGGVGLVDRHNDRARGGGGHVRVGPLGAGVGEDAKALAGLDAEVDQPETDLLDDVGELRVGHVVPGTIALVAHRGVLGVCTGRARDQIGDRLRARARRHGTVLHQYSLVGIRRMDPGY